MKYAKKLIIDRSFPSKENSATKIKLKNTQTHISARTRARTRARAQKYKLNTEYAFNQKFIMR